MSHRTDEELARDLLREPETAFREIYDRHAKVLLRFAVRFCDRTEIAEEILHEVFGELLRGAYREVEGGGLRSWLLTLTKNRCLNHRRAQRRWADPAAAGEARDPDDPEKLAIAADQQKILSRCGERLPPELRETWRLRRDGHGHREIAARLGIPVGTVKSRFHRIVQFFRTELFDG